MSINKNHFDILNTTKNSLIKYISLVEITSGTIFFPNQNASNNVTEIKSISNHSINIILRTDKKVTELADDSSKHNCLEAIKIMSSAHCLVSHIV